MQFEYDPERLIEEVKKRPGIWDYDHPDYRIKNARFKLWDDIVNEVVCSDVKMSKAEKRELEIQLQKKWKSIRDCFQKYIINPNRTKKPYRYYRNLQFLLKDQDLPRKNAEISSESEDGSKVKIYRSKEKLTLVKNETQNSDDDEGPVMDTHDDSGDLFNDEGPPPAKQPKPSKENVNEFVFANVDAPPKVSDDDPDRLFLLSLLPHLKTIPEENRLNIKIDLMQVLKIANYSNTVTDNLGI